jgi:hypothetical protein
MVKIERVEILMVDLIPPVVGTDAIQPFVSQETRSSASTTAMAPAIPATPIPSVSVDMQWSTCRSDIWRRFCWGGRSRVPCRPSTTQSTNKAVQAGYAFGLVRTMARWNADANAGASRGRVCGASREGR